MFAKYPSIENHYQQKWIDQFVEKFGKELTEAKYVITEKIHGANIQLIFNPGFDDFHIASRNQMTDVGFYNVGDVLETMDLKPFQQWADHLDKQIHLYGELFGPGIQKGVNYGGKKRILFFDMRIDGILLPQREFEDFFVYRGMEDMTVPVLHYAMNLEQALNTDTVFNSLLYDAEDNECEGIVIKPWEKNFYSNAGSLFYIKKKNTKFAEKTKKERKPRAEWSDTVNDLRDTFLSYLNEERLESVFSKEGRITDPKMIGKYIGFVMKDATDTFKKEEHFDDIVEEKDLTKEEQKYILSMDNKVRDWILQEVR